MEFSDKIKKYLDKGVEVSKNAFDKGVEVSKTAISKASNAVQDFSDKSVVRIERRQFETKRDEQFAVLGKKVAEKIINENAQSIKADDEDVIAIIEEIKHCNEELARRDEALAQSHD
ncbi:MAG: hypothetical protein J6I73_01080 [Treponema sp.]|nr:hypothetical protein [Treponema sp.]